MGQSLRPISRVGIFAVALPLACVAVVALSRCSSRDIANSLPPEPAGMRMPASEHTLRLGGLRCDKAEKKVYLGIEDSFGGHISQVVNHDGKRVVSVRSIFSGTSSAAQASYPSRASYANYGSGPSRASYANYGSGPSRASYANYGSGPSRASYANYGSGPSRASYANYGSGPSRASYANYGSGPSRSSHPHSMSYPNFASQPSFSSSVQYASFIILSSFDRTTRPADEMTLNMTFNRKGVSRAILTSKNGSNVSDQSIVADFVMQAEEMSNITNTAISCCIGAAKKEADCQRVIEQNQPWVPSNSNTPDAPTTR